MIKLKWVILAIILIVIYLCIRNIPYAFAYKAPVSAPTIALEAPKHPLSAKQLVERELGTAMLPVIACESGFKQFRNGEPLMSPTSDVGIAQINQVHWKRAKELGLDIFYSTEDNIAMAKIILKEAGIDSWVCHGIVVK